MVSFIDIVIQPSLWDVVHHHFILVTCKIHACLGKTNCKCY
jgi:hypothetical protein